jgi:hypothetical protein
MAEMHQERRRSTGRREEDRKPVNYVYQEIAITVESGAVLHLSGINETKRLSNTPSSNDDVTEHENC